MTIPLSFPMWLAAACPILVLLFLLLKCRWKAGQAAAVGFAAAGAIALLFYRTSVPQLAVEAAKGLWNALSILLVIWTAIALYEIMVQADAFSSLRGGIASIAKNELLALLLAGYVFPSFLQGITGFGVAVAVGAPLLAGLGVKPKWAVVAVLLCHSWGGTFGTLALAWQALVTQSGADPATTAAAARYAAAFLWLVNLTGPLVMCWLYGGKHAVRMGLPAVLLISLIHGGGELLLAADNDVLACFLPAAAALAAALLLARFSPYKKAWRYEKSNMMDRTVKPLPPQTTGGLHRAFMPYYILTALTVACLLIPPVKRVLGSLKIGFSFPGFETGYGHATAAETCFSPMTPLLHPGFFLLVTCVLSYGLFKKWGMLPAGSMKRVARSTVKKTVPSSLAIIGFILTSKMMGCSGEVIVLARGLAAVLGSAYPLVAPLIGLLGSFMTSSNMSSNILFAEFQVAMSGLVGANAAATLGAQTAGGAIGNAICPGNLVLGTSTVELEGEEGTILRTVLPVAALTALLCGVVNWLLSMLL